MFINEAIPKKMLVDVIRKLPSFEMDDFSSGVFPHDFPETSMTIDDTIFPGLADVQTTYLILFAGCYRLNRPLLLHGLLPEDDHRSKSPKVDSPMKRQAPSGKPGRWKCGYQSKWYDILRCLWISASNYHMFFPWMNSHRSKLVSKMLLRCSSSSIGFQQRFYSFKRSLRGNRLSQLSWCLKCKLCHPVQ